MFRVLSAILIPLVLVSQISLAAPHTHDGDVVGEPAYHASRPHFHCHHDGHHHAHRDDFEGQAVPVPENIPEHDSNAVYGSVTDFVNDGRAVNIDMVNALLAVALPLKTSASLAVSSEMAAPQSSARPKCASFVQHCCFRC